MALFRGARTTRNGHSSSERQTSEFRMWNMHANHLPIRSQGCEATNPFGNNTWAGIFDSDKRWLAMSLESTPSFRFWVSRLPSRLGVASVTQPVYSKWMRILDWETRIQSEPQRGFRLSLTGRLVHLWGESSPSHRRSYAQSCRVRSILQTHLPTTDPALSSPISLAWF
jgi:hypothetical protein